MFIIILLYVVYCIVPEYSVSNFEYDRVQHVTFRHYVVKSSTVQVACPQFVFYIFDYCMTLYENILNYGIIVPTFTLWHTVED